MYRAEDGREKTKSCCGCLYILDSLPLCLCPALSRMEIDKVVCLPRLSRVAVCGGTHGNELSGVYLVREMLKVEKKVKEKKEEEEEEEEAATKPLSVTMVLANPWATQQCRRYVNTDLNRCFTHACLR